MTSVKDVVEYYSAGYHTFVACDSRKVLDGTTSTIQEALQDAPVYVVHARGIHSTEEFAGRLQMAFSQLQRMLDGSSPDFTKGLHGMLSDLEARFRKQSRQGFLIIHDIDDVIEAQSHIEIEAPFREVMQFHDDVAILWAGSRQVITEMHQYERPFYLSHRIFWL